MSSEYLIRDLPSRSRPRERLLELGAEALRDDELIAILLRTGLRGRSVLAIAQELLHKFHKLSHLPGLSVDDLRQVQGIGRDKAATLLAAFELARRMARDLREESPLLDTPERIAALLREEDTEERVERFQVILLNTRRVERFQVILLNTRRRLIRREKLAHGTLDSLLVNPREVFRPAIMARAAAVILSHNHPSGDPTPSEGDIRVTRDLIRAGQLLRIEVLDHIIMGHKTAERPRDYASLRELGYFFT
jgi:DNA repair protein RadC